MFTSLPNTDALDPPSQWIRLIDWNATERHSCSFWTLSLVAVLSALFFHNQDLEYKQVVSKI